MMKYIFTFLISMCFISILYSQKYQYFAVDLGDGFSEAKKRDSWIFYDIDDYDMIVIYHDEILKFKKIKEPIILKDEKGNNIIYTDYIMERHNEMQIMKMSMDSDSLLVDLDFQKSGFKIALISDKIIDEVEINTNNAVTDNINDESFSHKFQYYSIRKGTESVKNLIEEESTIMYDPEQKLLIVDAINDVLTLKRIKDPISQIDSEGKKLITTLYIVKDTNNKVETLTNDDYTLFIINFIEEDLNLTLFTNEIFE